MTCHLRSLFNLVIKIFIYGWYTKVVKTNEFQQKAYRITLKKLNTVVKLICLRIEHLHARFHRFPTLDLNSKSGLLGLLFLGRFFHETES